MVIGLTGGTGVGKTSVGNILREYGIYVIDADQTARQVMEKGSPCLAETADCFGTSVLNSDGTLNRKKLGAVVFADREKLNMLNEITHKYILRQIRSELDSHKEQDVVIDAALLIESGLNRWCDYVISVLADEEIRERRIMQRDNISIEYARNRISSQKKSDFYIENSDYLVYNNSNTSSPREQVKEVMEQLTRREEEKRKKISRS